MVVVLFSSHFSSFLLFLSFPLIFTHFPLFSPHLHSCSHSQVTSSGAYQYDGAPNESKIIVILLEPNESKIIVIDRMNLKNDDNEDNDSRWYNGVRTLEWWPSSSGAAVPGAFVTACPAAS